MSQTTTPSGADVLAFCNAEPRITRDGFGHQIVAIPLWKWQEFAPAVAALISRNAELEAQTPSALREKLRSCEEALQAVEADRDALAGERDALREGADKRGRIIDLLESDLTQALLGEGFDMWEERRVRGQPRKRHRLPELVQDAILKMRAIDRARS